MIQLTMTTLVDRTMVETSMLKHHAKERLRLSQTITRAGAEFGTKTVTLHVCARAHPPTAGGAANTPMLNKVDTRNFYGLSIIVRASEAQALAELVAQLRVREAPCEKAACSQRVTALGGEPPLLRWGLEGGE